jgi:hypothetical protein
MFNKDAIVSNVLKSIVNYFVTDFGTLTQFSVDSSNKSLNITVMLKGELNELNLQLFGYAIFFDEGKAFLSFQSLHSSRQWLNLLYQKKFSNKQMKIEIPAKIAKPIKMFI